jgi:hypothetical protein
VLRCDSGSDNRDALKMPIKPRKAKPVEEARRRLSGADSNLRIPLPPLGPPLPRRHRVRLCPEPAVVRSGLLLQMLEMIGLWRLPTVPPGEAVPHEPLVQHPAVHAKFVVGTAVLILPVHHRPDARPKHRPPDRLSGLGPVRLPALGRIDAVELHPNNLPGLAEEMHRIAVEHPMHRSRKRLAGGRDRSAEESSKQDDREAWLQGQKRRPFRMDHPGSYHYRRARMTCR